MSSRNAVSLCRSRLSQDNGLISPQVTANPKNTESYLGLLYTMDDVAVYGYITVSKMKIILALSLSDTVVKDAEVVNVSTRSNFSNIYHHHCYSLCPTRSYPGVASIS